MKNKKVKNDFPENLWPDIYNIICTYSNIPESKKIICHKFLPGCKKEVFPAVRKFPGHLPSSA